MKSNYILKQFKNKLKYKITENICQTTHTLL